MPKPERTVTLAKVMFGTRMRNEKQMLRKGKPMFKNLAEDVVTAFAFGDLNPLGLIPVSFADELVDVLAPVVSQSFLKVADSVSKAYDVDVTVNTRDMLDAFNLRTEGVVRNRRVRMEIVLDKYQRGELTKEQAEGFLRGIADNDPSLARYSRTETAYITNQATIDTAEAGGYTHVLLGDGGDCGLTTHNDPDKVNNTVRLISVFRNHTLAHP